MSAVNSALFGLSTMILEFPHKIHVFYFGLSGLRLIWPNSVAPWGNVAIAHVYAIYGFPQEKSFLILIIAKLP